MRSNFFYRNWWLFYLLMFVLLGVLIYALLWGRNLDNNAIQNRNLVGQNKDLIQRLNDADRLNQNLINALEECQNNQTNDIVQCNAEVNSGGHGFTSTKHDLGNRSGMVVISYHAQTIPDKFEVIYNGQKVASTNDFVSRQGQLSFRYEAGQGKPNFCIVQVTGPDESTAWDYVVNCPQ